MKMVKLANILAIKGRKTSIIDSRTGAVLLSAEYQNKKYELAKVSGGFLRGKGGLIFQFYRTDGNFMPNELNAILLMTDCLGKYTATGMSSCNGNGFKGYRIGDDIEIIVEDLADKAIRELRKNNSS